MAQQTDTHPCASLLLDRTAIDRAFRDALAALIPQLRAFMRGLCGCSEVADMLAEEIMIRAWTNRARMTDDTNVRTWVFRLAHDRFLARTAWERKWSARSSELTLYALGRKASEGLAGPFDKTLNALQQLPVGLREALVLIGPGEVPFREAAEIMGCSIATAHSRYIDGNRALALALSD